MSLTRRLLTASSLAMVSFACQQPIVGGDGWCFPKHFFRFQLSRIMWRCGIVFRELRSVSTVSRVHRSYARIFNPLHRFWHINVVHFMLIVVQRLLLDNGRRRQIEWLATCVQYNTLNCRFGWFRWRSLRLAVLRSNRCGRTRFAGRFEN